MNALTNFTGSQLALIRRTVAKDTNETEFNLFVEMCKARGLNPLLRHAFAQVYNKDPKKDKDGNLVQKERQLVIVVSREGQRALAERTGAQVVVLAPSVGSVPGAETYLKLFDHNVATLAHALAAAP